MTNNEPDEFKIKLEEFERELFKYCSKLFSDAYWPEEPDTLRVIRTDLINMFMKGIQHD